MMWNMTEFPVPDHTWQNMCYLSKMNSVYFLRMETFFKNFNRKVYTECKKTNKPTRNLIWIKNALMNMCYLKNYDEMHSFQRFIMQRWASFVCPNLSSMMDYVHFNSTSFKTCYTKRLKKDKNTTKNLVLHNYDKTSLNFVCLVF